ncbi:MAG TPA: hypothetical protein DCZ41_02955 [Firmicutes bacterium]|nr:hypothetical protein [Bacillota bacterium]
MKMTGGTKVRKGKIRRLFLLFPILGFLYGCQGGPSLPSASPNQAFFVRIDKETKNAKLRVINGKGEEAYFAEAGDMLFASVVADNGYVLEHFLLNGIPFEGSSFLMPEEDVTIGASLRYVTNAISLDSFEHGEIKTDKKEAAYGDSIAITVIPEEGYYCEANSLKINDHSIYRSPIYEETTFSFLMPSVAITIRANFLEGGLE